MPTTIVIFGVTGDLAHKKIAPALAELRKRGEAFRVIGFARREINIAEYKQLFGEDFVYVRGDAAVPSDFMHLGEAISGGGNTIFYLAVPPMQHEDILSNLATSGIAKRGGGSWPRVIIEKPFGHDAASAAALNALLEKTFKEDEIYRIDHYLAKGLLQQLFAFRFLGIGYPAPHVGRPTSNMWNKDAVERIEVRLWESRGVEGRGNFYDRVGALRDVGQNHLLEALALATMEEPRSRGAVDIRAARAEALAALRTPTPEEVAATTVRAQYAGYRDIQNVKADSATETYFRIETALETPRWQGVPILLEGGKRMPEERKEVVIHFKNGGPLVFDKKDEGDPYARLIADCVRGDQTWFVSAEEIAASWRFIDAIEQAWKDNTAPLISYKPGEAPVLP